MSADGWNPATYGQFAEDRDRPFFDLLALVSPIPGGRAVDLGCGSGERTRNLHQTIGATETVGMDSSPAMLAKSAEYAAEGLRFERGDIAAFAPQAPFDLVFSNSALHWTPDHPALLARLTEAVKPGGQLAFQIPDNFEHPSHRAAQKVAGEEPFRTALGGAGNPRHVLAPESYASLLDRLGYVEQTVRLQVYGVRLDSRKSIVAWVEGSLLADYRGRLPAALYAEFLKRYRETLFRMVPDERPYFYTYRRILARARRAG